MKKYFCDICDKENDSSIYKFSLGDEDFFENIDICFNCYQKFLRNLALFLNGISDNERYQHYLKNTKFFKINPTILNKKETCKTENHKPGWEPNVWHDISLLSDDMKEKYSYFFLLHDDGDFVVLTRGFTLEFYKNYYKKYLLPKVD